MYNLISITCVDCGLHVEVIRGRGPFRGGLLVNAIIVLDKNKATELECIHGDVWACLEIEDSFVILLVGGGVPECAEQIIVVC